MNSLSLNPRFDTFRFAFPKELIPDEIYQKWYNVLNKYDKNVIREPIDIINESIQSVEVGGIGESTAEQQQTYKNPHINRIEPASKSTYRSSKNPVDLLPNEITVTFRHMQGFYNYFLLFETWFYHYAKENKRDGFTEFLYLELLDEMGEVVSHVSFAFPVFDSIDALQLSFNKTDRSFETFTCKFKFSNIDFELGEPKKQ